MRIEAYTQVQQLYNSAKVQKDANVAKKGQTDQVQISSMGLNIQAAKAAVKSAEQTIKGSGMGVTKKAQVIADVTSWLNSHHISITEAQLSILIEAAVKSMNMGG